MVQIIPNRPSFLDSLGEGASEGLSQFPQKLEDALAQYQQRKKSEKEQDVLARYSAGEEVPLQEMKSLSIPTQLKLQELDTKKQIATQKKRIGANVYKSLIDAGYPKEKAKLWQDTIENATQGGETLVMKHVTDLLARSPAGKGDSAQQTQISSIKPIEIPGMDESDLQLDFPEIAEPKNLTPSELSKKKSAREKINAPLYAETIDKLDALEDEFRDIQTLDSLEKTGNLPTDLEKWNVDWDTGDLRVLAASHPDAQAYVKTIYRMLRKARDFFPGRVTNFDLDQFKKNFPTLANSPEGRRVIIKQLELANRIAYLKEETVKEAIDHYGSEANPQKIRQYANENYRRLKGTLEDQLINLNSAAVEQARINEKQSQSQQGKQTLEELPEASQNIGRSVVDEETGEVYKSDGKTWRKV